MAPQLHRLVCRALVHARVVTASCYNCCAHPFQVCSTLVLIIAPDGLKMLRNWCTQFT